MSGLARCESCVYVAVVVEDDEPLYQCRRYPPVPTMVDGDPAVAFTEVRGDDWCGEFRPEQPVTPRCQGPCCADPPQRLTPS